MINAPGKKAQKKRAKREAMANRAAELETWKEENTKKRILIVEAGFVPVTYGINQCPDGRDDDESESSDASEDSIEVEQQTARLLEKQWQNISDNLTDNMTKLQSTSEQRVTSDSSNTGKGVTSNTKSRDATSSTS